MRVKPFRDGTGAHRCAYSWTHATADAGAERDSYAWTQPEADASPYTSTRRSDQRTRFRADGRPDGLLRLPPGGNARLLGVRQLRYDVRHHRRRRRGEL